MLRPYRCSMSNESAFLSLESRLNPFPPQTHPPCSGELPDPLSQSYFSSWGGLPEFRGCSLGQTSGHVMVRAGSVMLWGETASIPTAYNSSSLFLTHTIAVAIQLRLSCTSQTPADGRLYPKRCLSSGRSGRGTVKTHNDFTGQNHPAKPNIMGWELQSLPRRRTTTLNNITVCHRIRFHCGRNRVFQSVLARRFLFFIS